MSKVEKGHNGHHSRCNLYSNVGKGDTKAGRYEKLTSLKKEDYNSRNVALGILTDQQERSERVKERLQKKLQQRQLPDPGVAHPLFADAHEAALPRNDPFIFPRIPFPGNLDF